MEPTLLAGARWARVKDIVAAALDRSAGDRPSWLAAACAGDESLREEVESLLAAHDQAGDFLETPGIAEDGAAQAVARAAVDGQVAAIRHIGPYRVVREIGEGGMGVVYLAERADAAFEKQVAIKVVRGALRSASLLQRFREERRILATLEHPSIARLLDAGTTEEGLPYVVMELVDGAPVDEYCETNRLSLAQCLRLFQKVCGAVQYAHQHLVIHRDLKASNILVTTDGTPKLLDFGIARLLEPGLAADERTRTNLRALTLEVASPEQVRGEPMTVTSDVYSLGVLLYRLLTGHGPYGPSRRTDGDLVRTICEEDPPRPSAMAPPARRGELRGELDWIVLKALRKEPDRRYASAEQLSDDIQRHLGGRPVLAAPDSWGYRARKFAVRNRTAVAAGGLLALSLLAGVTATLWQARRAEANQARAERRFQQVRALANAFVFEFHDAIADLPGSTPARALVARRATEYLDSLAGEASGDPGLQRELAAAYSRLAAVQGGAIGASLGDTQGALGSYGKALAIREALVAGPSALAGDVVALSELEADLGAWHAKVGNLEVAESAYARALAQMKRAREKDPQMDLRVRMADVYRRQAWVQGRQNRPAEAMASLQEAVALGEAHGRDHPQDARARAGLAGAYGQLSLALERAGDGRRSLEFSRRGTEALEGLVAAEPHNTRYTRELIPALVDQGRLLREQGTLPDSIRVQSQALSLAETQLARDPRDAYAQVSLALTRHSLGFTLVMADQVDAGLAQVRAAARELERAVAADPGNGFAESKLADAYFDLGVQLLARAGRQAEAERCQVLGRAATLYGRMRASGKGRADVPELEAEVETARAGCPASR
jgi:eukaryotic-like serine/threonine-protein kinase